MGGPEKMKVKQLAKTLRNALFYMHTNELYMYIILLSYLCTCYVPGGRMVNSWSLECIHLVMTNLNVTIKVNRLRLVLLLV